MHMSLSKSVQSQLVRIAMRQSRLALKRQPIYDSTVLIRSNYALRCLSLVNFFYNPGMPLKTTLADFFCVNGDIVVNTTATCLLVGFSLILYTGSDVEYLPIRKKQKSMPRNFVCMV